MGVFRRPFLHRSRTRWIGTAPAAVPVISLPPVRSKTGAFVSTFWPRQSMPHRSRRWIGTLTPAVVTKSLPYSSRLGVKLATVLRRDEPQPPRRAPRWVPTKPPVPLALPIPTRMNRGLFVSTFWPRLPLPFMRPRYISTVSSGVVFLPFEIFPVIYQPQVRHVAYQPTGASVLYAPERPPTVLTGGGGA